MNKWERRHVHALERRRQYLISLRETGETNRWDEGEIAALNWVIKDLIPEIKQKEKTA